MGIPVAQRLKALRLLLKKKGKKALLITNLTNIRYLTGVQVSAGMILIESREAYFFLDSRYSEAAAHLKKSFIITPPGDLKKVLKKFRSIPFEAESVTVARLERWKKLMKHAKFIQTSGLIEGLRRKKDHAELLSIQRACSITLRILEKIPKLLKPGISEIILRMKIEQLSYQLGAEDMAFETIVGFGEHTSRPHHHATKRKLKRGDIVQIDMGVKCDGYCSDYSRVFFTAVITSDQKKSYRALKEAKKSAEHLLKPGVTNRALDAAARKVLKTYGFDKEFSHALGHGVGLDIHEGVTLSRKASEEKILKHEVVTLEPGLYFPGKWGMRIEDTYVVT